MILALAAALGLGGASPALAEAEPMSEAPRVLRVGPQRPLIRIADGAKQARDGDTIEIDAGEYFDDVAAWPQNGITLRGVGGRARLVSLGASAEGKAIWVIKGTEVTVENIEFAGARVPSRNGAGIRHEGGKLTVRNCLFERNEMGLLTWNEAAAELVVKGSEFRNNAVSKTYKPGDPIGHQLYVGSIGRFELRDSYLHGGAFGHLLKSRARENHVFYNRITDEIGGRASYEMEFPSGGLAYVVGNLVQQSSVTENHHLISYGAEGYAWPRNELYLVNNTLIDDRPREGIFLRVAPGTAQVYAVNNLLFGVSRLETAGSGEYAANSHAELSDVVRALDLDYRLKRGSRLIGKAVIPKNAGNVVLRPRREYVHPAGSRPVPEAPYSPGAFQSTGP